MGWWMGWWNAYGVRHMANDLVKPRAGDGKVMGLCWLMMVDVDS